MGEQAGASLIEHFEGLEDPRIERTKLHKLIDMIVIAVCGVVCGADSWVEIEAFGEAKEAWLRTVIELPNGIPSHDTFGRVFRRLDPEQFQARFLEWVRAVFEVSAGQVVAVDGKQLRGSHDQSSGKAAIHMVSAWASENRLVLGQVKVDEKSNEITAIPSLLEVLELKGCIVTSDAMGCQKAIAKRVVDSGGDYLFALKENQPQLYQEVHELFTHAEQEAFRDVSFDFHETLSKGHGRLEKRRCWTIADPTYFAFLRDRDKWSGLQTLVMIKTERRLNDHTSTDTHYFISSLPNDAKRLLAAARSHWSIENQFHWVLDVSFREDHSRVRMDHAAHNFAILRHLALNLLKQERSATFGIKAKRFKAALSEPYLKKVLLG